MSRLFRDVAGGRVSPHRSVVCIGAFDGLHSGHQALVRHTLARARACAAEAVVVSFEPLPREFLLGAAAPTRISSARDRFERLRGLGIDRIGLLRFNAGLAMLAAEAFIEQLLVGRLAACEVWVGEDFRFGHRRRGDLAMLRGFGERFDFRADCIDTHHCDGVRVSSSAVRAALAGGDLAQAERLLGRPYSIASRVVRGRQLGRQLGYPTANLRLRGGVPSLQGIYASLVHGVGVRPWPSVSSLGTRPTVDGREPLLEAHLFDFDGDLYGRRIEVEFVAKLREEERFADLAALTRQMDRDAATARELLRPHFDHSHHDQRMLA